MQDKDRERRRQKRLQKTKQKRADAGRPGRGGPTTPSDPSTGRDWSTGDCFVTLGWDEPGARLDLLFSRARPDGSTVLAHFEVDRAGPGVVRARALGGLRQEHVAGEGARLSEASGVAMVACSPGLVAALVDDAVKHGSNATPPGFAAAVDLLHGVPRTPVDVPFGPAAEAPPRPPAEGWVSWLKRRAFGASGP